MDASSYAERNERLGRLADWFAAVVISIGALVLAAWLLAPDVMARVVPAASLKPNAALALILLGIALELRVRPGAVPSPASLRVAQASAAAAIVLGCIDFYESASGTATILLRLLAPGYTGDLSSIHMAPNTAISLVLFGAALLLMDVKGQLRSWPAQYPAILGGLITLAALLGYLYGAETLYGIGRFNPIAVETATAFILLTLGILCGRPDSGVMILLAADDPGGALTRRVLPRVLLASVLAGGLITAGMRLRLVDPQLGIASTVILVFLLSSLVALSIARSLQLSERERRKAENQILEFNKELEQQVELRTGELQAANLALRESEEHLRMMIDAVKDYAIIRLDSSGAVVSWNVGAERIKGYKPSEVLGRSFTTFYRPEDVAAGKPSHELERAMADGRFEDEGWRVRRDGSRFWANVIVTPLYSPAGSHTGFVKITRDISERRRAEEQLRHLNEQLQRRTVELEASNKELEAFSYSVSHDLRTPLRSLDGFSLALLEDYSDQLDSIGRGYLGRMRAASQRMGQLIDNLLRLSRITRAQMRIENIDLSAMAQGVLQEIVARNPERTVEQVIMPGVTVEGDSELLRIAMQNLLGNAWKFTSKAPSPQIEFGATQDGGETVYYVRDNGAGFDMEYAAKLLSPFQRLHAIEEFPGTGIGLAMAQRIIHRHGGRIWAEGAVDEGATFSFTLKPGEDKA
jgi:PAS domain S-box-containing protein